MNETSLQHSHVQNQQQSSWMDDKFQTGTTAVKGVKSLSHKRNLSNYADELAQQYAKYDGNQHYLILSSLPDHEKNELSRLYLEYTNRETVECVHGNDFSIDNNYTCALLDMLKNDCQKTREKFAEITKNNILSYYEDSLQNLLDSACYDLTGNLNNENGFRQYQDNQTGEYCWGKF